MNDVLILGYTRTGRPVIRPTSDTRRVEFSGWTRGDHADASQILLMHGERESDRKLSSLCLHWSSLHWKASRKKSKRDHQTVRGAAETAIKPRRR